MQKTEITSKEAFHEATVRGAQGFSKIFNIPRDDILQHTWLGQHNDMARSMAGWATVTRGSDIFVKGMRKFDVMAVYDAYTKQQADARHLDLLGYLTNEDLEELCREHCPEYDNHHPNNNDATATMKKEDLMRSLMVKRPALDIDHIVFQRKIEDSNNPNVKLFQKIMWNNSWFISLEDLLFEGYVRSHLTRNQNYSTYNTTYNIRSVLFAKPDSPMRQHLIKYFDSWFTPENIVTIDELAMSQQSYDRNLHQNCDDWPDDWDHRKPRELVNSIRALHQNRTLASHSNLHKYDHLKELQDQGPLKVVRGDLEFFHVARELRNCAFSYIKQCREERGIFVTLRDSKDKSKLVALGLIRYEDDEVNREWSEIRLSHNRSPAADVLSQFNSFTSVIQKWAKKKKGSRKRDDDDDHEDQHPL